MFLAHYLWIPGAHLSLSHPARFTGSTVTDVPLYDIVPLLFSKVIEAIARSQFLLKSHSERSEATVFHVENLPEF